MSSNTRDGPDQAGRPERNPTPNRAPTTARGRGRTVYRRRGGRNQRGTFPSQTRQVNNGGPKPGRPFVRQQSTLERPSYLTEPLLELQQEQTTVAGIPTHADPITETANVATLTDGTDPPPNPLALPTGYAFDADSNLEASASDKDIADKTPDLNKAIEALVPLSRMTILIMILRNTMNGSSMSFQKATTSYAKFDANPDRIRKNVNIKPVLTMPYGLHLYPTNLKPIYGLMKSQFDALTDQYRKEASQVIHWSHEWTCFKLRLDRIELLSSQLIHKLSQFHIKAYKMKHKVYPILHPTAETLAEPTNIDLSTMAVHHLWARLDLEMLKYLDINRDKLTENFKKVYKPGTYESLSIGNQQAVDHVTVTMLGYIKPATCLYHKAKVAASDELTMEARLIASMDAQKAERAHSEVDKAIDQANLPKDQKTLHDTMIQVIRSEKNRENQKKQKAQKKSTTGSKKGPKKGPNPQSQAKHPKPAPKGKGPQKVKPLSNPRKGILKKPTPATKTKTKPKTKPKTAAKKPKANQNTTKKVTIKDTRKKQGGQKKQTAQSTILLSSVRYTVLVG
jgi:hypothetical protein